VKTTLLAAVDFSEATDALVEVVAALARAGAFSVALVHVIATPVITERMLRTEAQAADTRLERLRLRLAARGVDAQAYQFCGPAVREIKAAIRQLQPELVALGHRGHGAVRDACFGSVAVQILKHAPCPVLVVPAAGGRGALFSAHSTAVKTIAAAVDLSQNTDAVVRAAASLAKALAADLVLLHVFPFSAPSTAVRPSSEDLDRLLAEEQAQCRAALLRAAGKYPARVEPLHSEDSPAAAIDTWASVHKPAVIVLGRQPPHPPRFLPARGTGGQLLRHLPCSILVIPAPATARKGSRTKSQQTANAVC
jgi:nucleotide-binding universal stress UspA family protein